MLRYTPPALPTRCCIVSDSRYHRSGEVYWNPRNNMSAAHWRELLETFDEVYVFARAEATDKPPLAGTDLPTGVRVVEAPYYVGVKAMLGRLPRLLGVVMRVARMDTSFLLRGPGFLSVLVAAALRLRRKPYFVEVLGDAGEAIQFSSFRLKGPLAAFLRALARTTVRGAAGVSYVARFLSDRYPPRAGAKQFVISDVRLDPSVFRPAHQSAPGTPLRLVLVANMEQPYKGHAYLLEAMAMLRKRGLAVRLRLAGDGRTRPQLEQLAASLGLGDGVEFLGPVPWGEPLFALLDDSDLFVMPSLTEGMPKALLEALARGLPAIATPVGGLPEVLPPEALFPPADAAAIAAKVAQFHEDRQALARLAGHGRNVAEAFREDRLAAARRELYAALMRSP